MTIKSLLTNLGIGALIATNLVAANPADSTGTPAQKQNIIYSSKQNLSATGEGILLKDFEFDLDLKQNGKIDLEEDLGLYAKKDTLSYDVIPLKKGIKNIISYLNKDSNLSQEKKATIDYLRNYLNKTEKDSSSNDSSSIATLRKSLEDKIIDTNKDSLIIDNKWKINDGKYLIAARSKQTKDLKPNSLYFLVDLTTEDLPQPDTTRINAIKKENHPRIFFDGLGNKDMNGGRIGFGYGPIGISFGYLQGKDKIINEKSVPLSSGLIGSGKEEILNPISYLIGAEAEIGPAIIGADAYSNNHTKRVYESISSGNRIIREKTNSKAENSFNFGVHAGAKIKLTDKLYLRAIATYNKRDGMYYGGGLNFKLK